MAQQAAEDVRRHGFLVVGHWEPEAGDMEDALRGAAVRLRIVQHPLLHAVRGEDGAAVLVGAGGQREHTREPGAVEDEGRSGQARHFAAEIRAGLELIVEEVLQALVDRAEVARQGAVLFAAEREEVIHQRREAVARHGGRHPRLADLAQLQVEVRHQLGVGLGGSGRGSGGEEPVHMASKV